MTDLAADALAAVEAAIEGAAPAELPALLGRLEALKGAAWARLVSPPMTATTNGQGDRLLTAREVAERTQLSEDWLYRHRGQLPFARTIGRAVRFSEAGLERWMATRRH